MNKITVFVVNLKKDLEKKIHMQQLCKQHALECDFIDAVYGRDLSDDYIKKIYDQDKCIKEYGIELTKGEIGCALSHLSIFQKMIDENIEIAIVFEDDIMINDGFCEIIQLIEKFPEDWECILLGYNVFNPPGIEDDISSLWSWNRINITNEHEIVRLVSLAVGAHGYMINLKGAKKYVAQMDIISKPLDHYTGVDNFVNLYAVYPPCIILHEVLSKESNLESDRLPLLQKKWRQIRKSNESDLKRILKKIGVFKSLKYFWNFKQKISYKLLRMKLLRKYK